MNRIERAVKWCEEHGIVLTAVNENLPEIVLKYGLKSRKVYADIYLDDRAVPFSDFY